MHHGRHVAGSGRKVVRSGGGGGVGSVRGVAGGHRRGQGSGGSAGQDRPRTGAVAREGGGRLGRETVDYLLTTAVQLRPSGGAR